MGKRRHGIPLKNIHATIPEHLYNQVNFLLQDPTTGKLKTGARSHLITHLLQQWVKTEIQEKRKGSINVKPGSILDDLR